MLSCPKCGYKYPEWQQVCPQCGNPTGSSPQDRPGITRKGNSMTTAYIVGGLIVVIAIVAVIAFIMSMPSPPPPAPVPATATPAMKAADARPMPPSPPPALTATKSGSKITVSVMAGPTLAEVESFTVKLNDADVPKTLGTTAGSSITFDGAAGSNTVIIVAHYSNGSEMVVLNKSL